MRIIVNVCPVFLPGLVYISDERLQNMMGYINTFNARREEKVSILYSTILLLQESTMVLTLSKVH